MSHPKMSDLVRVQGRFLRSVNLQRDFLDPDALKGYVVTDTVRGHIKRIVQGLPERSGRRSWRITGDYGSGKSSFAVLLAHCLAANESSLPPVLRKTLDLDLPPETGLLPVLITGAREPIATAVLRGLLESLERSLPRTSRPKTIARIKALLEAKASGMDDREVIHLITDTNSELIERKQASGILIILDELGKFLEFAALHPERQDIFFLQQLAEVSARSGTERLFTVTLLHQGFSSYADQLSQSAQREWEKVAGRFEELVFDQPLDQIVQLLVAALNTPSAKRPHGTDARYKRAMRAALDLGWFGTAPGVTALQEAAPGLFPLHPTTVPVLVRLFSRFGQNERSLFSFLMSSEPFGLQDFLQSSPVNGAFRIHNLYDYAATNFGHHLSLQTYRNHWNHIESLVRSFPARDDIELSVIKTVAILNLLNTPEMLATEEAIISATTDVENPDEGKFRAAVQRLNSEKHVLYPRGRNGGYFLWSHASVNLEAAYEEAGRAVSHQQRVSQRVKEYLDNRPLVARRHYIETGNLRHFDVRYCSLSELEAIAASPCTTADGRVLIPLLETREEVELALKFSRSFVARKDTILGITEPLGSLAGLMTEAERWAWVQKHTPELKEDRYAAEEVARQLALATQTLEKRIQHYVGLGQSGKASASTISWFYSGKKVQLCTAKDLISFVSDLCDDLFDKAPRIQNEIINRRELSSAAASARMRLIERMFNSADKPLLGMDETKRPPEMSVYLSLLRRANLHVEGSAGWKLQEPNDEEDTCNVNPLLAHLRKLLEDQSDQRVGIPVIFDALKRPPFGVRDGVLPILLVLTLLQHEHELALYENGTFLSSVGPEEILRLTKVPELFELQLCKIQGVRREVFDKLSEMIGVPKGPSKTDILAVVRPLCIFAAQLPEYTRRTENLELGPRAVRDTLLSAREPSALLFRDLPKVLGLDPFTATELGKSENPRVQEFIVALRYALDGLKIALPRLKQRIRDRIAAAFEMPKSVRSFQTYRNDLAERSRNLVMHISDMELKAFALRLLDDSLQEPEWLESIGSLVATTPPSRWRDSDETAFNERIVPLVRRFRRLESLCFSTTKGKTSLATFRVEITKHDGTEKQEVIQLQQGEESIAARLAAEISSVIKNSDRHIAAEALSRTLWNHLNAN